jgi:hypothetical protein
MTILLDNIPIPEQGTLTINLTIEIKVTAEQARKKVNFWLMDQVSSQMGAETPTLVVGEQAVWRVPAYISFPSVGHAGTVGMVDVDAQTGEMDTTAEKIADLQKRGEEIAQQLPPYKPHTTPPEYIPKNVPPAKVLVISEDGQLKPKE